MTESRVLHIAPTSFFSDLDCHVRIHGIVRCLQQLGYDNVVATCHHGREMPDVKTIRIKPLKNPSQSKAGFSKYRLRAGWRLLWLCLKYFRTSKPIVIHAYLREGLLIGWLIKKAFFWRKISLIADNQDESSSQFERHGDFQGCVLLRRPTRMMERILMQSADHVICSSPRALGMLALQFSIPGYRISLAQDGADKAIKLSEQRRQELLELHEIPDNKKIVVCSDALLDSKGLAELQQLIRDSADLADVVHFMIIGQPTESLRAYLLEFDLQAMCSLPGRIEFAQVADFLSLADIAINPHSASSDSMIYYMAAGLPVVAFDTVSNAEFLPQGSPLAINQQQLSGQLRLLLADAGLCADFAEQNLRRFEQSYCWQVTREQLQSIYGKVLESVMES